MHLGRSSFASAFKLTSSITSVYSCWIELYEPVLMHEPVSQWCDNFSPPLAHISNADAETLRLGNVCWLIYYKTVVETPHATHQFLTYNWSQNVLHNPRTFGSMKPEAFQDAWLRVQLFKHFFEMVDRHCRPMFHHKRCRKNFRCLHLAFMAETGDLIRNFLHLSEQGSSYVLLSGRVLSNFCF